MKKKLGIALVVLGVVFLAIQLVPVDRGNPPVTAAFEAPPEVMAVVAAACADCHSHATRWPWYSRVAPVSWLVAHDVKEAREHMNLSTWGDLHPEKKAKLRDEMWEEVEDGEMPPAMYRLAHSEARLSDAAREVLRSWAEQPALQASEARPE